MSILAVRPTELGKAALLAEVAGTPTNVTYDRAVILALCPRNKHGTPWLPIEHLIKSMPTQSMKDKWVDNVIWMEKHRYLEVARSTKTLVNKTTLSLQARTEDGYLVTVTVQAPDDAAINPNLDYLEEVLESFPQRLFERLQDFVP